jgi:hypothetical protein
VVGKCGEKKVSRALSNLDTLRYKNLNDVLIRTSKGSCQIDHLVFSRSGIFIIETKNLTGWIHGNESSTTWTQTLYRYKKRFYNPILQNQSHVRALRGILKHSDQIPFYPIVVFVGSGVMKNVNVTSPVIYVNELVNLIESTGSDVLSTEQVESLFEHVQRNRLLEAKDRKLHISILRDREANVLANVSEGTCPRCGGHLMSRKGRYGYFFGCSNYPGCRFTLKSG